MLSLDVAERIRTIFLHDGEPVTIETAAKWLGWDLDTMNEAIKWKAVKLDYTARGKPRITFNELLVHATDQWTYAQIRKALGKKARRIFKYKYDAPKPSMIVRDALRYAFPDDESNVLSGFGVASLDEFTALRRRTRGRTPVDVFTPPPLPLRRVREDGVREFTVTALEMEFQRFLPFLRLRGRWLAGLGFKPGMRVYITPECGRIVITASDPAALQQRDEATGAQILPMISRVR